MLFWGKVKKYNQRGRKLGFPTANINLSKQIADGIYISKVKIENRMHPAITFIGKAETFNEKKTQSETYILDFNKNIYDKWITIVLLKKIRESKKFDSAKELIVQMKKDKVLARKYFETNSLLTN